MDSFSAPIDRPLCAGFLGARDAELGKTWSPSLKDTQLSGRTSVSRPQSPPPHTHTLSPSAVHCHSVSQQLSHNSFYIFGASRTRRGILFNYLHVIQPVPPSVLWSLTLSAFQSRWERLERDYSFHTPSALSTFNHFGEAASRSLYCDHLTSILVPRACRHVLLKLSVSGWGRWRGRQGSTS